MKFITRRWVVVLGGGVLLGILPGCAEVYLLNLATPFLLA